MIPAFDPMDEDAAPKVLEDLTTNASRIQEQVLQEILTKNAKTEYLKGFLDGSTDQKSFRKNVPVVDYEDIKPYIDRIASGEPSEVILVEPITELLISSGTSGGQPKLMPATANDPSRKAFFHDMSLAVLKKWIEGLDQGKRMYYIFCWPDAETPHGLTIRSASGNYYKSSKFRNRPYNRFNVLTSPDDVLLCEDSKQSMYCQILLGLLLRHEVVRFGTIFASVLVRVIKFLEEHWQELCSNIRTGRVSNWISDLNCRKAVSLILNKEMPELADSIENECKGGLWEGIIKKLWPRTKIIEAIISGSMSQYVPLLDFYSGGIPIVSLPYASSEGFFGINLNPLCKPTDVSYTLLPNMAYYEFIPMGKSNRGEERQEHQQAGIVDLANVKIGQPYELVVTTFSGLYRYKVGDILMATGFHNNAPQFRFLQRKNVVLSVDTDKTTEEDLLKAVTKAMHIIEPLGFLLTDYSSYVDTSSIPGHYVLFWELQMRGKNDQPELDVMEMEQCCAVVEQSLDSEYKVLRKQGNVIDPLEIRVVNNGTFKELMEFFVSQGSSIAQYKTPKCTKNGKAIQILNSRVVGRFSSKCVPS